MFITDDDFFKDNWIDIIDKGLAKNLPVILFPSEIFSSEMDQLLMVNCPEKTISSNLRFNKIKNKLKDFSQIFSYVGSIMVNRDYISINRDIKEYYGTFFAYLGLFKNFDYDYYICSRPLIMIRANQMNWTEKWYEIWQYNWPKMFNIITKDQASMSKNKLKYLKKVSFFYKALGQISIKSFLSFYKNSNKKINIMFCLSILIVSISPKFYKIIILIINYFFNNLNNEQKYYLNQKEIGQGKKLKKGLMDV